MLNKNGFSMWFKAWFVFCGLVSVGITGFVVWVVYRLLLHFGVV